jgi:NADH-ubiquinone oxidoreductase-F iron-sulfur binding region
VEQIAAGTAEENAGRRMKRLASLVRGRGACGHPDGATRFVLSALATFAAEFTDHARHGLCEACDRPAELPLPAGANHNAWHEALAF